MPDAAPADPALTAEFRRLMSLFATGVCVVSAPSADHAENGGIMGMTVNSFVSVSLDPMLVCWSLQNASSQFSGWLETERFAISILAESQQAVARRYAARASSGLIESDFDWSENGLPVVKGALARIECRHWASHPAGDHTMILGEVTAMDAPEASDNAAPLGFFRGRFCRVGE
ncbi:NADH-FMN oxidoreductase RutF, flavin reductase (DIM6/NTAB) family [Erythrobacter litoralis]|uniref:flavin reductase family protein n=1 Tax=Erythrobacter TaxID=1041 RepID=UPI000863A075|nr:flavin reductase family protein [Erythrobacter litoralis]AOL24707.1 NADH-FMN oxidoreductase RutF, flavin reductase (DIM6/NTAB) family [Erythrobacter litoralis]MEE4338694.1 flavin reductase family protein [Erythrobacter sp.]